MENTHERLLEAYFAGTLTQAEQTKMNTLLANDPDFAAELAWRQSVAHAIRTQTTHDPTYHKLKELERRFRFRRIIFQISAIAATLVLLIFAFKFFASSGFFQTKNDFIASQDSLNKPTSPQQNAIQQSPVAEELKKDSIEATEKLRIQKEEQRRQRILSDSLQQAVVANFEPYMNISPYNTAAGVDEKDSMAMRAFILYDKKQYKQASQAFKTLVETYPDGAENQFYYGVSLLGDKQFAASAKAFQEVTKKQSKYQTPAKFYLGMAHSGAGQFKEARQAFEAYLAAPKNGQFKDLAETMLEKLPK